MAKMFYTMDETKTMLKKTEEQIKQLAREGRLREFRDGTRLMFKADQVEQLHLELGITDDNSPLPSDQQEHGPQLKMFLNLKETMDRLGKTEEQIKQFAREGKLREFRDGPHLMFKSDQVEQLRVELGITDDFDTMFGQQEREPRPKMFLTLEEAMDRLGKSEEQIMQFSREGKLPQCRDGSRLLFKSADVEALRKALLANAGKKDGILYDSELVLLMKELRDAVETWSTVFGDPLTLTFLKVCREFDPLKPFTSSSLAEDRCRAVLECMPVSVYTALAKARHEGDELVPSEEEFLQYKRDIQEAFEILIRTASWANKPNSEELGKLASVVEQGACVRTMLPILSCIKRAIDGHGPAHQLISDLMDLSALAILQQVIKKLRKAAEAQTE